MKADFALLQGDIIFQLNDSFAFILKALVCWMKMKGMEEAERLQDLGRVRGVERSISRQPACLALT